MVDWLAQTKALNANIFAGDPPDKDIMTGVKFTALLLMTVASTILTVPLVSPMWRRMRGIVGQSG